MGITVLGNTPLHQAAQVGLANSIQNLLNGSPSSRYKGSNINAVNHQGFTPLSLAFALGRVHAIRRLLNHDGVEASINQADNYGMTALHHAASYDRNDWIIDLVLKGADTTLKDCDDRLPLQIALNHHNHKAAEALRVYTPKQAIKASEC